MRHSKTIILQNLFQIVFRNILWNQNTNCLTGHKLLLHSVKPKRKLPYKTQTLLHSVKPKRKLPYRTQTPSTFCETETQTALHTVKLLLHSVKPKRKPPYRTQTPSTFFETETQTAWDINCSHVLYVKPQCREKNFQSGFWVFTSNTSKVDLVSLMAVFRARLK